MTDGQESGGISGRPVECATGSGKGLIGRRAVLGALASLSWGARAWAQSPPTAAPPAAAPGGTPPAGGPPGGASLGVAGPLSPDWPRVIKSGETTLTFYLPQFDSWDGRQLEAHAAVSIQTSAKAEPVFGVAFLACETDVDKGARKVTLNDLRMTRVKFPSAPEQEANFRTLLQRTVPPKVRTMELDRLEAALAMGEARLKGRSLPLRNDPPRIVFTTTPAVLVFIDGPPAYRPVAGTSYARVANTHPVLLKDSAGAHYLRIFDGWMSAPAVTGPFGVARNPPVELDRAMNAAAMSGAADLLAFADPKDPKSRPSLAKGPVPAILVTQEATELIVTQGEPNYAPVEGTQLLYVTNTTGHVFKYLGDQQFYVLVTGRWFRAASLAGPWTHVPGRDLPTDFAKIPDDSPKENVKASVPGTAQAQEAVIANSIPETAAIRRSDARLTTVRYDGAPQLKPIEGTPLHYVVNSPLPVIQVDPTSYYALQNGVWFTGPSVNGPWTVAVAVPSVIYSIPPTSPLHYVTYVYVYRATPSVVYVGYTPGYYSVYVSEDVVVYGTGYSYVSWDGTVWYGTPVTYGFAASPSYTPWTGWVMGFGFGLAFGAATAGWGWGSYPWWGPYHSGAAVGPYGAAAWGPGGWAATTGNVYRRWGDTTAVTRHSEGYNAWTGNQWAGSAGMSYNSRTGTVAAGQRGVVGNVYSGDYAYGARGVAVNPRTGQAVTGGRVTTGDVDSGRTGSAGYIRGSSGTVVRSGGDVYATRDGGVYRNTGSGWQQRSGSGWTGTSSSAPTQTLNQQQQIRSSGQTRVNNYQSSGGYQGGGGARAGGGSRGGGGRRR